MIHYHGTPITPTAVMLTLAGKHFCVSHMRPDQVALCHQIGQSVMLDNGAFSKWKSGKEVDWDGYYDWCDKWLDYPTTWAVIPDEIEAGSQEQDYLIRQWPHGERGAPVWHMDEPIDRALRLTAAEIADILGWEEDRVQRLLAVYVDRDSIVMEIANRIRRNETATDSPN